MSLDDRSDPSLKVNMENPLKDTKEVLKTHPEQLTYTDVPFTWEEFTTALSNLKPNSALARTELPT